MGKVWKMPRKRKNRRHRRRVWPRYTKGRVVADLKDDMIENETDFVTPVREASSTQSLIGTTPVNRSKAYQRSKLDETRFNCTNLNYLFNCSDFEDAKVSSGGSEASNKVGRSPPSPNVLVTITVGSSKRNDNAICETPKISQIDLLDLEIQKTPQQSNLTASCASENVNNKDVNVEQEKKSYRKELSCVSLKRLRSYNDIVINASPQFDKQNNISFGEVSFFSPKLFYLQTASTPIIEPVKEETQALQCKVSNIRKQHDIDRLDVRNSTPKSCEREIEMRDFCIINNLSGATKKSNVNARFNFQAKIRRNTSAKSIAPFGGSPEKSDSFLHLSNGANRFLGRVKRIHTRYTSKWTERLIELCSWLGLTIRKVCKCVLFARKRN